MLRCFGRPQFLAALLDLSFDKESFPYSLYHLVAGLILELLADDGHKVRCLPCKGFDFACPHIREASV